jgi:hypothetical protein
MRKQIANACILSFFRIFVPNAQQEIHNRLSELLTNVVVQPQPKKEDILSILNKQAPSLKIAANPVNPQDKPFVPKEQKVEEPTDVKQDLLKKIKPE